MENLRPIRIAEAKKPTIDVQSFSTAEIEEIMEREVEGEIIIEMFNKLIKRSKERIVELYHQIVAFEQIKLAQKYSGLGALEIDQIAAKLRDNKVAIMECIDDIKLLESLKKSYLAD